MNAIKELISEESIVKSELTRREELLQQMEASSDLEFRGKMGTIAEFIKEDLKALEKFRERRTMLKFALEYTNKFTNEGVYTCRVRSIRGGSLVIEKWTNPAAVVVEQPEPFHLKVTHFFINLLIFLFNFPPLKSLRFVFLLLFSFFYI
jgi:hypothetical protein